MRFLVAVAIFLFHATGYVLFTSTEVTSKYLGLVTMGGWAGMSFFFMLSGFVLTWVSRPTDKAKTFWRRRMARVFPNHLVMFIVTAILMVSVLGQAFNTKFALANIFLVQAWFPQLDVRIAFNAPSWSLSAELLFYLCFPVLVTLIRKIRPERLWAWTIGMLAVITVAVPLVVNQLPRTNVIPFLELGMEQFWVLFQFPPVRMLEFIVGILLARIVMTGRRVPVSFGGAAAICVAAYAVGPQFPASFRMVAVMAAPLALLIVAGANADLNRTRPSFLSSGPMVYLGNMSYAFYLVHLQVLIYGAHFLGTGVPGGTAFGFAMVALLFVVACALSWLLMVCVEQPLMRRFGAQPRARVAIPAQAGPPRQESADLASVTAGAEPPGGSR
ncbi:acyltransferase [Alloactinosynnema sp. L-07]|uniref:acyltransferase family protein n=1 Tax=Alloactinosynnema sp. L-07 TaxID=1653480 RepID=UPI000A730BAF